MFRAARCPTACPTPGALSQHTRPCSFSWALAGLAVNSGARGAHACRPRSLSGGRGSGLSRVGGRSRLHATPCLKRPRKEKGKKSKKAASFRSAAGSLLRTNFLPARRQADALRRAWGSRTCSPRPGTSPPSRPASYRAGGPSWAGKGGCPPPAAGAWGRGGPRPPAGSALS